MGLDIYVKLVAGLPIDDVLERTTIQSKATRYNEETGQPYEKSFPIEVYKVGKLEMSQQEYYRFNWEDHGLAVFNTNNEDYVGMAISEIDYPGNNLTEEFSLSACHATIESVKDSLEKLGVKEKPRLCHLVYISA